jgi:hypothetical protein
LLTVKGEKTGAVLKERKLRKSSIKRKQYLIDYQYHEICVHLRNLRSLLRQGYTLSFLF